MSGLSKRPIFDLLWPRFSGFSLGRVYLAEFSGQIWERKNQTFPHRRVGRRNQAHRKAPVPEGERLSEPEGPFENMRAREPFENTRARGPFENMRASVGRLAPPPCMSTSRPGSAIAHEHLGAGARRRARALRGRGPPPCAAAPSPRASALHTAGPPRCSRRLPRSSTRGTRDPSSQPLRRRAPHRRRAGPRPPIPARACRSGSGR